MDERLTYRGVQYSISQTSDGWSWTIHAPRASELSLDLSSGGALIGTLTRDDMIAHMKTLIDAVRDRTVDGKMPEVIRILAVIESAIDRTKRNAKAGQPAPGDELADEEFAWIIRQELRRAGFEIRPIANRDQQGSN